MIFSIFWRTAALNFIGSWLTDIGDGKCVGSMFLDLKKAFDLVDHARYYALCKM